MKSLCHDHDDATVVLCWLCGCVKTVVECILMMLRLYCVGFVVVLRLLWCVL